MTPTHTLRGNIREGRSYTPHPPRQPHPQQGLGIGQPPTNHFANGVLIRPTPGGRRMVQSRTPTRLPAQRVPQSNQTHQASHYAPPLRQEPNNRPVPMQSSIGHPNRHYLSRRLPPILPSNPNEYQQSAHQCDRIHAAINRLQESIRQRIGGGIYFSLYEYLCEIRADENKGEFADLEAILALGKEISSGLGAPLSQSKAKKVISLITYHFKATRCHLSVGQLIIQLQNVIKAFGITSPAIIDAFVSKQVIENPHSPTQSSALNDYTDSQNYYPNFNNTIQFHTQANEIKALLLPLIHDGAKPDSETLQTLHQLLVLKAPATFDQALAFVNALHAKPGHDLRPLIAYLETQKAAQLPPGDHPQFDLEDLEIPARIQSYLVALRDMNPILIPTPPWSFHCSASAERNISFGKSGCRIPYQTL
jgi:hypothetical protein